MLERISEMIADLAENGITGAAGLSLILGGRHCYPCFCYRSGEDECGGGLSVEKQKNVREKLVELLDKGPAEYAVGSEGIADHLIANGVTFAAKWIPVTERLPEFDTDVLVFNGDYIFVSKYFRSYFGSCDKVGHLVWRKNSYAKNPTHWMPLPQQPKGE